MAACADVPVRVVDRVTLPRTAAAGWVARMHREYRPAAEARGYAFAGVWQTRADTGGPAGSTAGLDAGDGLLDAVDVVVEWRLADVRAFFRSRATSHEPATVRWWAETDALALHRTRSVLGPVP